ncbi:MAG: amidohydrolase [Rhodothermales bacterium]|nr:amidohydrolase [Rhodothermales bacterium]
MPRFHPGAPLFIAALLLIAGCVDDAAPPADLILVGGQVVTVDPDNPTAEAVAVAADTILAVGSEADIRRFTGESTRVIDVDGALIIPGLIEGHGHYMSLGRSQMILDLTEAANWNEIVQKVADAAEQAESGEWIQGRGWHQEKWDSVPEGAVEGNPTHQSLSAVSPDNPVLLGHASGHAAFANAEAMRLAGISPETPDPAGGEILRDARGEPTGALRETAQGLVSRALSRARQSMTVEELDSERRTRARLAAEEALRNGITSFQDAGSSLETVDFLKRLAEEDALPVRLYVMIRDSNEDLAANLGDYMFVGLGDNHLTVRSIKRSIDGALGSHGAWLLEPYEDLPSSAGLNTSTVESIERTAELAAEHGFQLNVHAIGDRANREVLDIFEDAIEASGEGDHRWRIEHSQHLHPDDIPRFADLGVIASMQGIHATSDAPWVLRRLGERRAESGAYVWRTLWQSGAVVTNGTDVPVEKIDPIASYYATVSRRLEDGGVFYLDERLTREQALQSYTLNNAFAAFEEDIKGSLTPGKLADITVLSQDILSIPEESIPSTRVLYTIVGGRVLYDAAADRSPPGDTPKDKAID